MAAAEGFDTIEEAGRHQKIVTVEECDVLAFGMAQGEVSSATGAKIRRRPIGPESAVFGDGLPDARPRVIRRRIVHDDTLPIGVALSPDRLQGLANESVIVVNRNHN